METLTRKQREIRQREGRILQLAREMLLEHGYHGLSMDRIAERLEYSKGTIYQHFPCKEEIVLALANEAFEARLRLFRRAAAFQGRSRERITAIGMACELFVQLFPHHFQIEQVIRLSSVAEKTSVERQQLMRSCETLCMETVSGIVRDAIANRDLVLPPTVRPEQVVFGLWSLTFGAQVIAASSQSLVELGIDNPMISSRLACNFLLDGLGWRPTVGEMDLDRLTERIGAEVFRDEVALLTNRS